MSSRQAQRSVGKFGIPPGSYPGEREFKSHRSHETPADRLTMSLGHTIFPSTNLAAHKHCGQSRDGAQHIKAVRNVQRIKGA
jgi:hypothetical protein